MNPSDGLPISIPAFFRKEDSVTTLSPAPVFEESMGGAQNMEEKEDWESLATSTSSCRTRLFPPLMIFSPPMGTNLTVLVSDGSNLTAVPEQMSRRLFSGGCCCHWISKHYYFIMYFWSIQE